MNALLEARVLELLCQDARYDFETLSVMLGAKKEDIAAAVAKMEHKGVLMGYGAIVNREKLNEEIVSALIEVKVAPQRNQGFDAIAELIYTFPEVKSCYLMSGTYDLMVIVEGKNIREVAGFVSERLSLLDNVMSCATHFILKRYKDNGRVFTDKESDARLVVSP